MLRLRRWLFRNPVTPTRTKPIRTTRLGMEQLEAREVPAQFTVSLLNPGTGRAGSAGASFSGAGLSLNNPSVEADSAADAVRLALAGSVDVSYQGRTANYAFSTTTAGTDAVARNFAYLVAQPAAAVDPAAWRIGLEDLSASNMQSLGVDWDYNDRYWDVTVTEVATPVLGDGTGLLARYFNGSEAPNLAAIRIDPEVNNDWGTGSPDPAVTADRFTATWNGEVLAAYTQTYKFTTVSDDGVRLWVNGQLLVDNWTNHSATRNSGSIALEAGQKYDIRMEYYENTGLAAAKLLWSGRYQVEEAVPQAYLYPDVAPTPVPGEGTGLLARYVNTSDAPNLAAIRVDAQVNNDWGTGSPGPGVGTDRFRATWTGQVQAPFDGPFTFSTLSDDGVRLWVDGNLVIDNWTDHGLTRNNSATVALTAGEKYDLRMEYYENGGGAVAKLFWASPDLVREVIPTQYLYPAEPPTPVSGSGTGLDATYFADRTLTAAVLNRVDPQVNNTWSAGSPAAGVPADNFSVRWSGYVQAPLSGPFTFSTVSDDGVRLWVDGNLVIDNWTDHSATRNKSGTIELEAGAFYRVVMEYYERSGQAVAQLEWASPDLVREPIPQQYLYPVSSVSTVSVTASTDAAEGGDPGTFTLTRTGGDPSQPLTAWFTLGGTATKAADYTVSGATYDADRGQYKVTFPADGSGSGSGSSEVVVTISAVDDSVYDPDESVALTVVSGPATYAVAPPDSATIAIVDNEPDAVVWVEAATVDGVVGVAEGTYTILKLRREQGDVAQPLSVLLAILPDAEGNKAVEWGVNATLTGPAGEDLSTGGFVTFAAGSDELLLTLRTWASELDGTLEDQRAGFRLAVIPGSSRYDAGDSTRSDRPAGVDVQIDTRPYPIKQVVTTEEDSTVQFQLNAIVTGGLPVSYSAFSQPLYGTLSVSPSGMATYTPDVGFIGFDELYFRAQTAINGVLLDSNLGVVRVFVDPKPLDSQPSPDPLPAPNARPSIWLANSLQWARHGSSTTLVANVSDPDDSAPIVEWDLDYDGQTFRADPSLLGSTVTAILDVVNPGLHLVAVRVTDSAGQTGIDVGYLHVLDPFDTTPAGFVEAVPPAPPLPEEPPVDPPPVYLNITPVPQNVPVGGSLNFSATAGGVPASSIEWDFNYTGDPARFAPTSFGANVAHTFVGPGKYTVAAGVYEGLGDPTIESVTVVVRDVPAVVVIPPLDIYATEGDQVSLPTPAGWFTLLGPVVGPQATVDPTTAVWDSGDKTVGSSAGVEASFGYRPGQYVATFTVSDTNGNVGTASVNVTVYATPPIVSLDPIQFVTPEGTIPVGNLPVPAGAYVQVSGEAFDLSGIVAIDWDYNYDGLTFTEKPVVGQAGSTFSSPNIAFFSAGPHVVAARVRAADGTESIITTTVNVVNSSPTGLVRLAPTRPTGLPQVLTEGKDIYFEVTGLGDSEPTATPPSLWADWEGDGVYDFVPSSSWIDMGTQTFQVGHDYLDDGKFSVGFRFIDSEGGVTESTVEITVIGVAPTLSGLELTNSFGTEEGMPYFLPGTIVNINLTDVYDPSPVDTAGLKYFYRVDGGDWVETREGKFGIADLSPGRLHSVAAAVVDPAGLSSKVVSKTFLVKSDRAINVEGDGRVYISGDLPGGGRVTYAVDPGTTFRFNDQITGMSITLRDELKTYNLSTNFGINEIIGDNLRSVTLDVRTEAKDLGLPIGNGDVGRISVGNGGIVNVVSRGNFGGLVSPSGVVGAHSDRLIFKDLTGPIRANTIESLQSSGTISDIVVESWIHKLSAGSIGVGVTTNTYPYPNGTAPAITITIPAITALPNHGTQPANVLRMGPGGEILSQDFIAGAVAPIVIQSTGWLEQALNEAGQFAVGVQQVTKYVWTNTVGQALEWTEAGLKYAAGQAGELVANVRRGVAEGFVNALGALGIPLDQVVTLINEFTKKADGVAVAANSLFTAIVNKPELFIRQLALGVQEGFTKFGDSLNPITGDPASKILKWLGGEEFANLSLPQSTAPAEMGNWLLKTFGFDWEGLQGILIEVVGAGNVAVLADAYNILENIWGKYNETGDVFAAVNSLLPQSEHLTADSLTKDAVNAIANTLISQVAQALPVFILKKLNPAVGGLTSVIDSLLWLVRDGRKLLDILKEGAGFLEGVGALADAINAPNPPAGDDPFAPVRGTLAAKVEAILDKGATAIISFGLAQIPIRDLPKQIMDGVRNTLAKPREKVVAALKKQVEPIKTKLGGESSKGLLGQVNVEAAGKVFTLGVRLNAQNEVVIFHRGVSGQEKVLNLDEDLPKDTPKPTRDAINDAIGKLRTEAGQLRDLIARVEKKTGKGRATQVEITKELKDVTRELNLLEASLVSGKAVCYFGQACFAAGTPLRTPWGAMNIEDVRVGDTVLSRDEHDPHGAVVGKVVEEVFVRLASVWELLIGGRVIGTSGEHPFYVWEKGWTAAREMKAGDTLLCEDGVWRCVDGVRDTGEWQTVYNLRVADHHTYFVGDDGWGFAVWAHNAYATLYHYSVPGIAIGHWSIDIEDGGNQLHTHQAGAPGTDTSIQSIGGPLSYPIIRSGRIFIPDGQPAITLANQMIGQGNRGAYDLYFKSCVSYVCDILRAAGLSPPAAQGPPNGSVQLKYLIKLLRP